jgi:hypothetical protein
MVGLHIIDMFIRKGFMKGFFFFLWLAMAGFSFKVSAATVKLDTVNHTVGFTNNVNGNFPGTWSFSAPSHRDVGVKKLQKRRIMYSQVFGMTSRYLQVLDNSIPGSQTLVFTESGNIIKDITVTQTPIPAAIWLFGSALVGLMGAKRRKVS